MKTPLPLLDQPAPVVPLGRLDHLWFQVGGTRCNLECRHCFISCSPHNRTFGFLDLATVRRFLDEAVGLGVQEYYFTGGEPFLNPEMTAILELAVRYGSATVLTNGTIFKDDWLERLRRAQQSAQVGLEFRVSLDGPDAATNDPIRGPGTFDRALRGVRQLVAHGFAPIITVTRIDDGTCDAGLVREFVPMLRAAGYDRPRLKVLPTLRIGAEAKRRRGYHAAERVTADMMVGFDLDRLVCHHGRIVTDRGVHVCPILIEAPDARLGSTLAEARVGYPLRHQACHTCYLHGAICTNASNGPCDP